MSAELFDEVAYVFDGSLEGLLTAIFEAYARHEDPTDVCRDDVLQPRLAQRVAVIATDVEKANRVRIGLERKGGNSAYRAVRKASASSRPDAGTIAYRFVRYVMDKHKGKGRPFNNIAHPDVAPLYDVTRSINQECEHMRQFIRFEHLKGNGADLWFAKCNPRDSVIPFIMDHFAERFNVQPFIIYDENHGLCGVYEGERWYLVPLNESSIQDLGLPQKALEEDGMQSAWRTFYDCVAIQSRYNPELRRHFMPKRFWKNLTEMQGS